MTPFPEMIAVNGNGISAFLSAIALKRAFVRAKVCIFADTVEFTSEYPGAATPFIRDFHRQIGLNDRIFFQRTGARIVHCFEWQVRGRAAASVYPLSAIAYPEGVAIHHAWRALETADRPDWAQIVRKFQSDFDRSEGHGIRFDANAYLRLLVEMAAHLKIDVQFGNAANPRDFDLVVDAQAASTTVGQWEATDAQMERDSDLVVIGNGDAIWTNPFGTTRFGSIPDAICCETPWFENRLRIGHAALAIETCDGHGLCAAMADILRAIALMPARPGSQPELAEYNRRTQAIHTMLADWHNFKWQADAGEGLGAVFAQFEHRGRIPFRDEDPVRAAEWTNWLLSTGTVPAQADATALSLGKQKILEILGID